jgi:hypothetical protein
VTLCWAEDVASARKTAHEVWPTAGIQGEASQELPSPKHFEQLAQMVTEDQIAESVPCGPDPAPVLEQVRTYLEAGFDNIYFHQVGPDQQGFIDFAKRELLPELAKDQGARAASAA